MARFSGGGKMTGVGSATLPACALHSPAGSGGTVREIGVTNTTATACDVKVVRLSTAGTPGATITVDKQNPDSAAAAMVLVQAYSSTAPTIADLGYRCSLGAAIGSGFVWTFGDAGLRSPAGTTNGIGLIAADGSTLQILQFYFVWDE